MASGPITSWEIWRNSGNSVRRYFFWAPKSLQMVTAAMKLKDVYSLEGLDAWGWCTGTTQRDGMGREEGSGWGTCVYLWQIHFDIWQNQYNIVKFKNIIKLKQQQQQ